MSATNRGAVRSEFDYYPTPQWCTRVLLLHLDTGRPGTTWFEPCRGGGHIYDLLPGNKDWAELTAGRDYLRAPYRADVCVTNPPFSLALEFLRKSLAEFKTTVYLLRLGFLGSKERLPFWRANPPTHQYTLADRPSFTEQLVTVTTQDLFGDEIELGGKKGGDSADYAWFVWDRLGICNDPPGMYWLSKDDLEAA